MTPAIFIYIFLYYCLGQCGVKNFIFSIFLRFFEDGGHSKTSQLKFYQQNCSESKQKITLPEASVAPEMDGWKILLGPGLFSGALAASLREGACFLFTSLSILPFLKNPISPQRPYSSHPVLVRTQKSAENFGAAFKACASGTRKKCVFYWGKQGQD